MVSPMIIKSKLGKGNEEYKLRHIEFKGVYLTFEYTSLKFSGKSSLPEKS